MKALILVDIQNDFIPGGALAVQEGDMVVPVANKLQEKFELIVATQDWHPQDHGSFAANNPGKNIGDIIDLNGLDQIMWPVHCVQNSAGAEFHPQLNTKKISKVFPKGTDKSIDSYSGFYDNGHRKATGLAEFLKKHQVDEVFVCGLATDYCVKFTVLDALKEGFKTTLVSDGCRGVNLNTDDSQKAIEEMRKSGCNIINSSDI
ncbi:MAG: bifunctional nicotinamidase/pyrazinamidase [Calditrichaeota bacterium]|nr:bifunctional nicotinamidase/pyrazinamidase [Calditrichota bacterium]